MIRVGSKAPAKFLSFAYDKVHSLPNSLPFPLPIALPSLSTRRTSTAWEPSKQIERHFLYVAYVVTRVMMMDELEEIWKGAVVPQ